MRRRRSRARITLLSSAAFLLTVAPALVAQARSAPASRRASMPMLASVDSNLLKGLHWRMVGPDRGGRVTSVTGVPSQPFTFYMGVASGGVWKTTDAGQNWFPITDGQIPLGSIGAIQVAESNPNIVYVEIGRAHV